MIYFSGLWGGFSDEKQKSPPSRRTPKHYAPVSEKQQRDELFTRVTTLFAKYNSPLCAHRSMRLPLTRDTRGPTFQ
jgi:hypothetical protein